MAVSTLTSAAVYEGNNSTSTPYAIPFPFLSKAHIKVAVTEGEGDPFLLDPGNFTVTRLEDGSGGSFVTTTAVADTATVTVFRTTPLTQPSEFPVNGPFPSTA